MNSPETLDIKAKIQVAKPAHEVFEAIADPDKMSNYFIAKGSGRLETEGSTVKWNWPEFDGEYAVRVGRIEADKYISFYWNNEGHESLVEIVLTPAGNDATVITVTEKSRNNDEGGIKWLKGNTEGWANFLACLKAWMEYDINLRKGAFDFMRKTD